MPKAKYKKRKDGRYYANIDTGRDESGKRIRVSVYGRTAEEIESKIAELRHSVKTNTYVRQKSITFKQYSDKFVETKRLVVEPRTVEMYESILNNYASSINSMKLIEIQRADLQEIINENVTKGRTCQKIKVCFGAIFKQAMIDNLIVKNPCIGLQIPHYQAPEKRPLTDDEKTLLEETEFTDKQKVFLIIGQNYGLRKEEILALRKDSFNFKTNEMKVNHAAVFIHSRPTERPTKNHESRTLKLFPDDAETIKAFIDTLEFSEEQHIFRNNDGRWITLIGFRRMWENIIARMNRKADELGIPHPQNLTCHTLRHNFATDCYYAGLPMLETRKLTGHKSMTVLTQIYTHLDEKKRDPRDTLLAYRMEQKLKREQELSTQNKEKVLS